MSRRAAAGATALALALGATAAVGEEPRPSPAPLAVGAREFLSDLPALLAGQDGWYAREGVKVVTRVNPQGRDSGPLLLDGTLDLAVLGDHWTAEALSAAAPNDPLVVLACLGGGGGRWRLMASARSGIASLEGLHGRTLGAWPRSYGYRLLDRLLREKGIRPRLVKIPMDSELAAAALEKGEADALLAWEPVPSLLEDRSAAREIFTLDGMGGGVPVYLLARKDAVRRRRPEIVAALRALARASAFVREQPDKAAASAAVRWRLPARVLAAALRREEFSVGLTCAQRAALKDALQTFRAESADKASGPARVEFDPEPVRLALGESAAPPEHACGK
jgi:ABC-type nitrate/sulfonate/bicarbonate transport system substrate-binding protein